MKVLHVVPTYVPAWTHGGPIYAVHGLCKALAKRGHSITVFTTDVHGSTVLDVPRSTPIEVDGVNVLYFPVTRPRRLYRSPAMGEALATRIRTFDLVHLHSVFLWPTAKAARLAARAGVPYLLAPRGMLVNDLLQRRGRLRKRLWIDLVERQTLADAAGVHVTTELEARELAQLSLPSPPIYVVANGVDLPSEESSPTWQPTPALETAVSSRPLLFFLGRLSWKKGIDRLLSALSLLSEARLVVAGSDELGHRAELERQAAALGLSQRVLFVGPVGQEAKAYLFRHADLLVLPSYSENFGNVVLESMAAAVPVVVTPEVGVANLVREVGAGLVTSGDAQPLAAAIDTLLKDPTRRRDMGRRGREAALQHSWYSIALQIEEVYRTIVNEPGGDRPEASPWPGTTVDPRLDKPGRDPNCARKVG